MHSCTPCGEAFFPLYSLASSSLIFGFIPEAGPLSEADTIGKAISLTTRKPVFPREHFHRTDASQSKALGARQFPGGGCEWCPC